MKQEKLLTFQLRPHIAAMLDAYIEQVNERLNEAAKRNHPDTKPVVVKRSKIIRALIKRPLKLPVLSLEYIGNRRFRDNRAVQLRVRCTETEYGHLLADSMTQGVPMSTIIGALIVEAMHPDGNFPPNPDTNPVQPTEDTHHE